MAKSSLERSFEKYQKEMERQFKKKLASDKKIADKQRRDSERQLKMMQEERGQRLLSWDNQQLVILEY